MAKILEAALRAVMRTQNVEALIVATSSDVVYKIPRGPDKIQVLDVIQEGDHIIVRALKTEKICPVSKSPLDAYRGRGLHSRIELIE
jgi:hypothetical protein